MSLFFFHSFQDFFWKSTHGNHKKKIIKPFSSPSQSDQPGDASPTDVCWNWELGSQSDWQEYPSRRKVARAQMSKAVVLTDGRVFVAGGWIGTCILIPRTSK